MIVIVRKIRVEGLGTCFRALFALLIGKLLGDDEEKVKKIWESSRLPRHRSKLQ